MKPSKIIKKEPVLCAFFFLLIILAILYPEKIVGYPSFIDWETIIALTGLLIVTTGLKESGYFAVISKRVLKKLKKERDLSIFLILFSVFLSTFLTNDITLFIVIPLTISMQNLMKNDISKLLIFEAIAVNVGSALTPIGNPQNLFLWHKWGISFITFIIEMLPLVILLFVILLIFVWFCFPKKEISFSEEFNNNIMPKKVLFILSMMMLIVYVISLETKQANLGLILVFVFYLISYRRVFLKVDWLLLLLFVMIFIDFHVISTTSLISKGINAINLHSANNIFLISMFASQLVSNVPASILISKFSHNWFAITYGVNVAGNGLVIASLANIIALKMVKSKKTWLTFHKYSIPYFLITGGIAYVLFFVLQ